MAPRSIALALAGLLAVAIPAAQAQAPAWPAKPIRIIEPAGPGSAVDVFARKLSTPLGDRLGQPVVVENRPGANSGIGAREVARAAPDGYTLLHANINNSLNDVLTNDPCCRLGEQLVPIGKLTATPLVMVVHPSVAKSLREFLAAAKSQPGKFTFASGGTGAITQVLGVRLNQAAGIDTREIPYKAIGAELPDLLAGHVSIAYLAPVVVAQHIQSGKLIALGVASAKRVPILANVPTLAEAGLPDVEASGWNGLFAPAGTPKAIITRLHTEMAAILASPDFRADAQALGYDLGGDGPDEFTAYIKAEMARWGKVIRDAKIKAE